MVSLITIYTVESIVSGHPWKIGGKGVPVTSELAALIWARKNAEFVWESRKKRGFVQVAVRRAVHLQEDVSDRRGFNELQPCSKYSLVVLS